jgi:poly(3-hydroxybutyrate) depolymerase
VLYQAYETQRDLTAPWRAMARATVGALDALPPVLANLKLVRLVSASNEILARAHLSHERPPFGIQSVEVSGRELSVHEEPVLSTPFGTLVHFAKEGLSQAQPRVLVVAALAGHFSTLLRSTVRALLADHDVYLTDWHNARDVALANGPFGLDDYVADLIGFLHAIGPGAHLMAVCQPCPAALAAAAIMSEGHDVATPRSLTLMGGPVDTRINPTIVNHVATSTPLSWFEDNVITTVPARYRGAGRDVYPGFLQVSAFMSMNLSRHVDQHLRLFSDLATGDDDRALATKAFYDEYFAVMDIPAEFYLETVDAVFQRHLLAIGELEVAGRRVHPSAIRRSALLTVEGERDDICGLGQTMAAHSLCANIPASRRHHHLQAGVGHYGIFSGTRWERQIYPVVRSFIHAND